MEKLSFNDVVRRERDPKTGQRRVFFPTLCVCSGCGGYSAVFHSGKTHKDPELAFQVALVQFGYSTIQHYDNDPPSHPCNCEQRLQELRKEVEKLTIVTDGGWNMNEATSRPIRGIRDYDRVIQFERNLSSEELKTFGEFLQRDKCPGWTGIHSKHLGEGKYQFSTTWDSSD